MSRVVLTLLLLAAMASAACGADLAALERRVQRNPCDYPARRDLVSQHAASGELAAAYHHAAWLAWLGPREYVESAEGEAFLRNRGHRDRARRDGGSDLATITMAVEAQQMLLDTCLNGAIAQQATRLRRDIADMADRAAATAADARAGDPVVRMALARLALTLDDAFVFEGGPAGKRTRLRILRAAASRAQAAAAIVPDAPGPRRLLAVIRSRLAELDGMPELWDLAIAEAEAARALDPEDADLAELLWVLHLRAGRWEEARLWQRRVEAAVGACQPR